MAISNNCPSNLKYDEKCELTCASGFDARGSFSCYYGGFSQLPGCILKGRQAIVKRYFLSGLLVTATTLPVGKTATQLQSDTNFYTQCGNAIADGLNEIEVASSIVESVQEIPPQALQGNPVLWISFKVRVTNDTGATYWLGAGQALTKARFASSLQTRVPGLTISKMVLAPPRLGIQYAPEPPPTLVEYRDQDFFQRLFESEKSDGVTVLLGGFGGVFLGLLIFFVCLHYIRKWYPSKTWSNDDAYYEEADDSQDLGDDYSPERTEDSQSPSRPPWTQAEEIPLDEI
jgi:hypothetical protein